MRDRNTWWFWLDPLEAWAIKYAPAWQAETMEWIGPFTFRADAERERVDRLMVLQAQRAGKETR